MKEWVKFSRSANGRSTITVTMQDGNLTARWSTRAYTTIKAGVAEARAHAERALNELEEAVADE